MGDPSGPRKPSVPSWQLPHQSPKADPQEDAAATTTAADNSDTKGRESLLEQASQFLQDESIRDAPTDRKVQFLESKGLRNDEIQKLLGVSRNPEASDNTTSASTESSTVKTIPKDVQDSNPQPQFSPSSQTSSSAAPESSTRPDVPPVITYPEFLYQAQKPPPLVSLQSVLYTIYAASGIAASIYGASEFLVKPMVASLNDARHDLAETAQHNLNTLNDKLEKNVSTIPALPQPVKRSSEGGSEHKEGADDDAESVTSDPTELFHRDIATQTAPDIGLNTASSVSLTGPADTSDVSSAEQAVNKHLSRLQNIHSTLNEAQSSESSVDAAYNDARDCLLDLHTYLDGLAYSSPSYLSSSLYGVYNDDTSRGGKKGIMTSGEEEAISGLRAEVRSVKGALLSAKNFPSGGQRFRGS